MGSYIIEAMLEFPVNTIASSSASFARPTGAAYDKAGDFPVQIRFLVERAAHA